MATPYTKEQSTYHSEREKKEAKKPKLTPKISENKKPLRNRRLFYFMGVMVNWLNQQTVTLSSLTLEF